MKSSDQEETVFYFVLFLRGIAGVFVVFTLLWVWVLTYCLIVHEESDAAAALQRIAAEYREDLAQCSDQTDCQVETARRRLSEQELRTRIHALEGASK